MCQQDGSHSKREKCLIQKTTRGREDEEYEIRDSRFQTRIISVWWNRGSGYDVVFWKIMRFQKLSRLSTSYLNQMNHLPSFSFHWSDPKTNQEGKATGVQLTKSNQNEEKDTARHYTIF